MKHFQTFFLILLTFVAFRAEAQYYAKDDTTYEYNMKGTVYANKFEGRKTSSGEVFSQKKYTAAHWKIKLGTLVMVSCPETGKQIIVKVNDRCPTKGVIDLSRKAADEIGIKGLKKVVVKQLPDSYLSQWEQQDGSRSYAEPAQPTKQPVAAKKNVAGGNDFDDEDPPQY